MAKAQPWDWLGEFSHGDEAPGGRPTGTSQVVVVASDRRPQQLRALLEPELGLELRLRLELGQQTT